tara:strand:- start:145 stop:1503 length:1359 start_codon:yes stop_codon:yes gene_type:complete
MLPTYVMKKHLTALNKIIRKEHTIKGISKMKKDEVTRLFNDLFEMKNNEPVLKTSKSKMALDIKDISKLTLPVYKKYISKRRAVTAKKQETKPKPVLKKQVVKKTPVKNPPVKKKETKSKKLPKSYLNVNWDKTLKNYYDSLPVLISQENYTDEKKRKLKQEVKKKGLTIFKNDLFFNIIVDFLKFKKYKSRLKNWLIYRDEVLKKKIPVIKKQETKKQETKKQETKKQETKKQENYSISNPKYNYINKLVDEKIKNIPKDKIKFMIEALQRLKNKSEKTSGAFLYNVWEQFETRINNLIKLFGMPYKDEIKLGGLSKWGNDQNYIYLIKCFNKLTKIISKNVKGLNQNNIMYILSPYYYTLRKRTQGIKKIGGAFKLDKKIKNNTINPILNFNEHNIKPTIYKGEVKRPMGYKDKKIKDYLLKILKEDKYTEEQKKKFRTQLKMINDKYKS